MFSNFVRKSVVARFAFCGAICIAAAPQSRLNPRSLTPGATEYAAQMKLHPAESVNALLLPIVKKYRLPAMAVAVTTSHQLIAVGAVGVRKWRSNSTVTILDPFHLGSDTKAMTASLAAMLVEKGKLHWNEPVEECLPKLASKMLPIYRGVTLQQLLQHRSGFSGDTALPDANLMQLHNLNGTPQQQRWYYVTHLLMQPPVAPPGSKFIYSNRNYAVVGAIEETVSGLPWEQLITNWLFRPLGMTTAGFGAAGNPGKEDAPWGHIVVAGVHVAISPGPMADNPVCIAPAGEVHCSIEDWAKYVALQLRALRGDSTVLSKTAAHALFTPQFGGDYAGGWLVTQRPWANGTAFTHAGSNTLNYCVVWMAPNRDFAVMVATNQGNGGAAAACDDAATALIERYLLTEHLDRH